MARSKNANNAQRTASSTPIMDPWDVEHQQSLAAHGPMASTNQIYPSTIHRGFETDLTARPLTRRYPTFEETKSHREFLVRSRSERLITTGERDNYYTPEQLWEVDDRLRGTMQFAREGEPSWVDEEEDSSDEEGDAEGPTVQRNVAVEKKPEVEEDDTDLPITLQANDHVTTVAAVIPDYKDVQDLITSLNLSATAPLLATTITFTEGTLAVALCGQQRSHEKITEDAGAGEASQSAPVEGVDASSTAGLNVTAADDNQAMPQADASEWNVVLTDARLPTVSLLSGKKTLHSLMAVTDWDTEATIATIVKYSDGRVVATLMGQQHGNKRATAPEIDFASFFNEFFQTIAKSTHHGTFPEQHKQLASLLETTRKELVKANAIIDLTASQRQS
jgi:hypothetical protein